MSPWYDLYDFICSVVMVSVSYIVYVTLPHVGRKLDNFIPHLSLMFSAKVTALDFCSDTWCDLERWSYYMVKTVWWSV